METYLPYPTIRDSLECLSKQDLYTARVSAIEILNVLHEVEDLGENIERYEGHPLVRMWRGHEVILAEYGILACEIYTLKFHMTSQLVDMSTLRWHLESATSGDFSMDNPRWFGDAAFHRSQKSILLRHDPMFYQPVFGVFADMEYPLVWPRN